jgi:hypothetical protein
MTTPRVTTPRVTLLSAVALAVPLSNGYAGPCPLQIDPRLAARMALGPSAPQSIAAQMHHQPTVASVVAAEKKLAAAFGARMPACHAKRFGS